MFFKYLHKNSKYKIIINLKKYLANLRVNEEMKVDKISSGEYQLKMDFDRRVYQAERSLQPSLLQVLHNKLYTKIFSRNRIAGIEFPKTNDYSFAAKFLLEKQTLHSASDIQRHITETSKHIQNCFPDTRFEGQPVAVQYSKNQSRIVAVNRKYINQANMFISLGLDTADTLKGNCIGAKGFNELIFGVSRYEELPDAVRQLVIWPHGFRSERYKKGLYYFYDERYVDQEIYHFVDNYMIPRLFADAYDDKVELTANGFVAPRHFGPILFCGYSLGARVNALYISAFRQRMIDRLNMSVLEADEYIKKIMRVNIGAAIHWPNNHQIVLPKNMHESIVEDYRLTQRVSSAMLTAYSLNFLSLNDMGILKTESLMNAVYYNSAIAFKPYSVIHRSAAPPALPREFLITLGEDQIPEYSNPLGHNMLPYFKGLKTSAARKFFELPKAFLLSGQRDSLPLANASLLQESAPFEVMRKPSSADKAQREETVANYLERQAKLTERKNTNNWQNLFSFFRQDQNKAANNRKAEGSNNLVQPRNSL